MKLYKLLIITGLTLSSSICFASATRDVYFFNYTDKPITVKRLMADDVCMKKTGSDKIYTINPNAGDYWAVEDSNSLWAGCMNEEKSTQFLIDNTYSVKWSHYPWVEFWSTRVNPVGTIPTPVSISAVCDLYGLNCYKKGVWDDDNKNTFIGIRNK